MDAEVLHDITAPEVGVEVEVREDRSVLWVNVDGVCVLRVCQIPKLKLPGEEEMT